jgi:hypothetical protein
MASQPLQSFGYDIPDAEWKKIDDINACLKSILPTLQEICEFLNFIPCVRHLFR